MQGIDIILKEPKSIIQTYTAEDVLWKGIDVDCTNTTFSAKVVCSNMASRPVFERQDNRHLLFTWGSIRNTKVGQFKVMRGHRNIQDVNKVIEYKEMTKQRVWSSDECNQLKGTDGLLFPPEMKKGDVPQVFVSDACRTLPLYPTSHKGWYRTLRYTRHAAKFTNVSHSVTLLNIHRYVISVVRQWNSNRMLVS